MRIPAPLVLAVALVASCKSASEPNPTWSPAVGEHRVLFIGNSLTRSNDLPRTLQAVAALGGESIVASEVTVGGYGLEDHMRTGAAQRAIAEGGWEYVILQQGPSSLEENRANLVRYTREFDKLIRAKGARTALYMVWPELQYFSSFARVGGSYLAAAEAVDGLFLPSGLGWIAAWETDPSLELYGPDGFHPSPLGTYLAALVMYERITGKDPRQLPPRVIVQGEELEVPEATVRVLQAAAHEANTWYQFPWH